MKILLSLALFVFLAPVFASAVNINYTPLAPIPGTVTSDTECTKIPTPASCKVTNLGTYLHGIYMTGVALAGLFVVFSIVRGGFTLLFTDSILGKTEGKSQILHALGGLLIVFSSFLLMNTINPQLGRDLNLNLSFPQKNITPFVGTVKPITDLQERLLLALSKKEAGAVADAQKWTQEAADWEKEAAIFPSDDPRKKAYLETAQQLRADAATVLVVKKGDVFGENAKTAAQNANPSPSGVPDASILYARTELQKMDQEYKGDASVRPGIDKIIGYGDLEQGLSLYEKWNTDYTATERAIAESYIGKDLVNGTGAAVQNIREHAEMLLENLDQYKSSASAEKKAAVQTAIDHLKRDTCNAIQYVRDSCQAKSLSCRTLTSGTTLSCQFRE